jgi:hypothetical protein
MDNKAHSISQQIRSEFPGVYFVAGIGWCGPQWQAAAARESELRA